MQTVTQTFDCHSFRTVNLKFDSRLKETRNNYLGLNKNIKTSFTFY